MVAFLKVFRVLVVFFVVIFPLGAQEKAVAQTGAENSASAATVSTASAPVSAFAPQAAVLSNTIVSSAGSLQWSYPIQIPEGTNGVQPAVALTYNSAGPNGLLGVGFSLTGLSAIERDPSRGINFNGADNYMLDGQRLYLTPLDKVYHPERESYDKIQAFLTSAPSTPTMNPDNSTAFWVVTKKDGTKLYYGDYVGSTSASTIPALGKSTPRLWALSKVQDANGDYYTFQYLYDSTTGAYYLTKIIYTKNDLFPLTTTKTVQFSYETRTDHAPMYQPSKVDLDHRLKWITILAGRDINGAGGSTLVRKYRMDYSIGSSTGRSQLTTIQEYGNDGSWPSSGFFTSYTPAETGLPPVNLVWQSGSAGPFASLPTVTDSVSSSTSFFADVNGDGLTDWLKVSSDGTGIRKMLATGTGFATGVAYADTVSNNYPSAFADISGDGKADWVKFDPYASSARVMLSNSSGGFTAGIVATGTGTGYQASLGDVNGDGMVDWIRYKTDGTSVSVRLSDGTGAFAASSVVSTSNLNEPSYFVDVNGDGKADWVKLSQDGTAIWVSFATNGGAFDITPVLTNDATTSCSSVFADVNGDGKADWIKYKNDSSSALVLFSRGDGTFVVSGPAYANGATNCVSTFADIDGDGRADWIKTSTSGTSCYVLTSKGDGTFNTAIASTSGTYGYYATYADFNGDGKADWFNYSSDGLTVRVKLAPAALGDLATTIQLPTGGSITATYKAAPQATGAVDPTQSTYPDIANSNPRALVINVTSNPGITDMPVISTSYQYTNGKYHSGLNLDRIDLGFQKVTKIDDATGSKTVTTFSQTIPFQGLATDVKVTDSAGTTVYDETVNTYLSRHDPLSPGKVQFVYQTSQTNRRFDGLSISTDTKKTFDTYDAQGNLTQITDLGIVNSSGTDTTTADNTRVAYTYALSNTGYLYRMTKEQVYTYDDAGVEGLAKETRYYYDTNNSSLGLLSSGLLTQVESVVTTNPSVTTIATVLVHDSWGNVTKTTDPSGVVTSQTDYDNAYHSLITTTDSAGLVTTVTGWDTLKPATIADPQGNVATVVYDKFGRKLKAVSPLPRDSVSSPTTELVYNDTAALPATPSSIQTKDKTSGIGSTTILPSYTWFDGLGRPVQTKTQNKVGGQYVTVDTYYDASGRKVAVSNPYLSASASFSYVAAKVTDPSQKKTTYSYDLLNRVTQTTNPDGTFSRSFYSQTLTTSVDELSHVTQTEDKINVQKKRSYTGVYPNQVLYTTVTVTSTRGKTVIEDDKDNNPGTAGNKITTLYDMVGRKTSYTDPDMGTWSYSYNANGSLNAQTDAAGNVVSFEYDTAGRAIKKWEGTVAVPQTTLAATYTFGDLASGYQKGHLTGVVAGNSTTLYTYDQLGRTVVISKTVGVYGTKTETVSYNADGRPMTLQLDSGETVGYGYSAEGQLNNVAGTSTYLASVALDDFGRMSSQSFGNSTTTAYTFDAVSFRTTDIVTTGVMNLHYSFDAVGNILTKTEATNTSANETFTYDDLYRLKTATGIYGSRNYLYDTIGNLLGQNNVANNTYTDIRPHAINGDGTSTYAYDANGNMVSRTTASVVDRSYTYDVENRMTQAIVGGTQTDYTYDDTRQRTTLTTAGETTVFWFGDYEETYTTGTQTSLETVRSYSANGAKIAQRSSVSGLVFLYQDHLGSTSKVRDSVGAVTARYYEPYGKLAATDDGTVRQLYTGQEWDASADLYYYNARFYSATLGRFVQPDSVLDGLNRYAYCHDNPINGTDPSGHWSGLDDLGAAIAGAVVGALTNAFNQFTAIASGQQKTFDMGQVAASAVLGAFVGWVSWNLSGGLAYPVVMSSGGLGIGVSFALPGSGDNPSAKPYGGGGGPSGSSSSDDNEATDVSSHGYNFVDWIRSRYETRRAEDILSHHPGYGNGGTTLWEEEYDCTTFLSAVTGFPRYTTGEWIHNPKMRGLYFMDITADEMGPGDWRMYQYTNKKSEIEGHTEMYLGNGMYVEAQGGGGSTPPGVRINNNGSLDSVSRSLLGPILYLRPRNFWGWGDEL